MAGSLRVNGLHLLIISLITTVLHDSTVFRLRYVKKHISKSGNCKPALLTRSMREQGRSLVSIYLLKLARTRYQRNGPTKNNNINPRNPPVLLISPSVTNYHQKQIFYGLHRQAFLPESHTNSFSGTIPSVILFIDTPIIQGTNRKPLPISSLRPVSSFEIPSIM